MSRPESKPRRPLTERDEGARAERRRLRAIVRTERDRCHRLYFENDDPEHGCAMNVLDRLLAKMRAPRKKR